MLDRRNGRLLRAVQVLSIAEWMMILQKTDAVGSCYLLMGVLALWLLVKAGTETAALKRREWYTIRMLACVLSAAVVLANYRFIHIAVHYAVLLFAGYTIGVQLLTALYVRMSGVSLLDERKAADRPVLVFFAAFSAFAGLNMVHLFLSAYPGNLSYDSIMQIAQIQSGEYSNHHPYWHTRLIGLFYQLGMGLFGDINAAAAMYNAAQVLMMAACFAYAVMTVYQSGARKRYVVGLCVLYTVLPYHIMYSCTMWKDVLFGGTALVFVTALYRVFHRIGRNGSNLLLLCVGAIGMALFRSNGWLALLASVPVWVFFFKRKWLRTALVLAAVLAVSWVIKSPVPKRLGVEAANFRESLSIPIQQIARVIVDGGEITPEQMAYIERVIDVSQVPQLYQREISDPVKFSVDGAYIQANKKEYLKLWIDIGLQNPVVYLHAWIDQTKGYWNEGYDYGIWYSGMQGNYIGLYNKHYEKPIYNFFHRYYNGFMQVQLFVPLRSIGLHVWLLLILFVFNWLWGCKEKAFLAVPVLMMIGTLLVATPVFSEFRYAYAVFTVLPTYLMMSLSREKQNA